MSIELTVQDFLICPAIRAMACTLRLEGYVGALSAMCFDRNIAQPFCNAQNSFFI